MYNNKPGNLCLCYKVSSKHKHSITFSKDWYEYITKQERQCITRCLSPKYALCMKNLSTGILKLD